MKLRVLLLSVLLQACPAADGESDVAIISTTDMSPDPRGVEDATRPSDTSVVDLGRALEERPRELLTLGEMPAGAADDDPMLFSVDGRIWLTFLSDRDGEDSNVYVTSTLDGEWSDPAQVSDHPDDEWYPTMGRDSDGVFHLVWTRVQGPPDFFQHIIYNRSEDGVTWDVANEVNVTSGVSDDVFGHLVIDGSALRVYFASRVRGTSGSKDLFVTSSTDGGDTWDEPVELASLTTSDTEQFAWVEQLGDEWQMVFVRSALADATNYLAPSTELWTSRSPNGFDWDAPVRITNNESVDTLASLFADPATGDGHIFWISTDTSNGAAADFELALTDASDYPAARVDLTEGFGIEGWSPRVAATVQPGLYLVVTVASGTGEPRLYATWIRR